ncbi:Endomembrane protein 70-domain-containing protein [Syncephalis plumigaleata]|nr:Endomembrane protein 70-domain-containing protein [Syncephalis plumigaleata]
MLTRYLLAICLLVLLTDNWTAADEYSHLYIRGDPVVVWRNAIGPYDNPFETYAFDQLPYCPPAQPIVYREQKTLREIFQDAKPINAGMAIQFQDITKFQFAIEHKYWYELSIDGLPIWAFIGIYDAATEQKYLYTHQAFTFYHDNSRIIDIDLKPANPISLSSSRLVRLSIHYTYSVEWITTDKPFKSRYTRQAAESFFSFQVLIIAIITRSLRKDLMRYNRKTGLLGDLDCDLGDDYGWKQLYGDVLRPPRHLSMFTTLLGTGYHMGVMLAITILLQLCGHCIVLTYAATSFVAGYISGKYYRMYGGRRWVRCTLLAASLWPAIVALTNIPINIAAYIDSDTSVISFKKTLLLIIVWLLIICPLSLLGAIVGRKHGSRWEPPCRVYPVARVVPEQPKYLEPVLMVVLAGILPFCLILIAVHYFLVSLWTLDTFYVYGFIFICLCFLVFAEEHRWHWKSFLAGGSVAFYVYIYLMYYFVTTTKMTGLIQTSLYLVNITIGCAALFVILGAIGYIASSRFVCKIYRNLKMD